MVAAYIVGAAISTRSRLPVARVHTGAATIILMKRILHVVILRRQGKAYHPKGLLADSTVLRKITGKKYWSWSWSWRKSRQRVLEI